MNQGFVRGSVVAGGVATNVTPTTVSTPPHRWIIKSMGTAFSLAIVGESPATTEKLVTAIKYDFGRIESSLSVLRPDSELYQWQHGYLHDAQLSMETREVMAACELAEELTGGLFSAQHAGQYDPTFYVKGWALEQASRRLDEAEVGSYYLNGDGDITARGDGPDGLPWRLGVGHPFRPGELATVISEPDGDNRPIAVATSRAGPPDCHVTTHDDWAPALCSVTVAGHNIAFVNMASAAALAAGRHGSHASAALVHRLGLEAIGFDENQNPWWTEGMRQYAPLPQTTHH